MNKVEEIEEFHQLTDEEVEQYELRSENTVIRVGTIIKLTDKRLKTITKDISGTYTVVDCDIDTFTVRSEDGRIHDILWWDVSGKNPIIQLEKIKY